MDFRLPDVNGEGVNLQTNVFPGQFLAAICGFPGTINI